MRQARDAHARAALSLSPVLPPGPGRRGGAGSSPPCAPNPYPGEVQSDAAESAALLRGARRRHPGGVPRQHVDVHPRGPDAAAAHPRERAAGAEASGPRGLRGGRVCEAEQQPERVHDGDAGQEAIHRDPLLADRPHV